MLNWTRALAGAALALAVTTALALASSIESLPTLIVNEGVGVDEDFTLALAFTPPAGSLITLSGITFTAMVSTFPAGLPVATLAGTVNGSTVIFFEPAASKAAWAPGVYLLAVTATDGTYTKDITTSPSSLTVGSASPPILRTLSWGEPGNFIASIGSPSGSSVPGSLIIGVGAFAIATPGGAL